MINSINTHAFPYATFPAAQADQHANSRQKRSATEPQPFAESASYEANPDKGRRRTGGGLDSLGQGRIL
jgi:hypothetical protein